MALENDVKFDFDSTFIDGTDTAYQTETQDVYNDFNIAAKAEVINDVYLIALIAIPTLITVIYKCGKKLWKDLN
jgi:hypothetical protein